MSPQRSRARATEATRAVLLALLLAGALPACTSSPTPEPAPAAASPAGDYEIPTPQPAATVLSAELASGPHHRVIDPIATDGFTYDFRIESEFGRFEAQGEDALRIRLWEIEVLARARALSKSREFAQAADQALTSPLVATWNLIRHPVDTVAGIPVGAWRYLRRTASLAPGRNEREGSAWGELIGFAAAKRKVADRFGVDPYTSNRVLQRELNRFAWAAYAGGLPFQLVPFAIPERLSVALAPPLRAERVRELLRDKTPEELRARNRERLASVGVEGPEVEAFLRQPAYSPLRSTLLVEALVELRAAEGREVLIATALDATGEGDAFFYQRIAEMLQRFDASVIPIQRLLEIEGWLAAYTPERTLGIPLRADHLLWTEPLAVRARALSAAVALDLDVRRTELLLSGSASPRALEHLSALGFSVTEGAFRAE